MEFEINQQRTTFLEARGKIVLNACPGSGKTTSISKKLMILQEEYTKTNEGKYCGVACLSFTNTAKDEINEKFTELNGRPLQFPNLVSTIDSFVNQYITLPFYYLQNKNFTRPKIIDDNTFINEIWKAKFQYKGTDNKPFCFAYPPSSIRYEIDGTYSSNGYKPDPSKVAKAVFEKYCKSIKEWQIANGLITTGDSAYIALQLLKKNPKIGNLLSLRFPHLIIDEAQDSSAIQHAIFENLIEQGLKNIEFVGDPYQSLYEWRDADPSLFLKKYQDKVNWKSLDLTDNRRSPQRIIDCFSNIRCNTDPAITSACTIDKEIPITIYKYTETNSPEIIKHFDHQCKQHGFIKNYIVMRGNTLKNQMLGKTAEQEPWKSMLPYDLIQARHLYDGNEIKDAVKTIRHISVALLFHDKDYHEKKEQENYLKNDHKFNSLLLDILHNIPDFNKTIDTWTTETQNFIKQKLNLNYEVNFEVRTRSSKYFDKNILKDHLKSHFKKSHSANNIPITTIHQVKGKTLDSILIFFNENSHKEHITFNDIGNATNTFPSEKQRLIYVAISRPKHFLAMAFPNSISDNQLKQKFGDNILIVDLSLNI
jgi:superfamily I DNA/RNA helicase